MPDSGSLEDCHDSCICDSLNGVAFKFEGTEGGVESAMDKVKLPSTELNESSAFIPENIITKEVSF